MTEMNTATADAPRGCAVVTGGARGIGKAVCEALAARGYNVAVNHSHAGSAEAAAEVAASLRERFARSGFCGRLPCPSLRRRSFRKGFCVRGFRSSSLLP